MFTIFKGSGEKVGVADNLNYIRKHKDGYYVLCRDVEAQGIAFEGTVYSLFADKLLDEAPLVYVHQSEAAKEIEAVNATAGITFVTMAEKGEVDGSTVSEHIDLFAIWAYPVKYEKDQIRQHNGVLYRCITAHTSQADWEPGNTPTLWTQIADPTEEWPEWSAPIGAHDVYAEGDKVSHNDKHWVSGANNNVWEPGVYGWTEEEPVEEE